jgi:16S rRNA (uracil1498-N3)-methyltransferase
LDRFFVQKEDINLDEKSCLIKGEDVKHISKVLRYKVGQEIEVCDNENNEYICEIDDIEKNVITLSIIEKVEVNRESPLKIRVYQGLPKGSKMEIILQKLTEVGVYEIIPVITKRSVSKIDDKKEDKKLDRWERIIYEASKQSKRGIIPKLSNVLTFDEAIKHMKNNDMNIVPYERENTKSIKQGIRGLKINSIGVFVGPEGGFEEEEIQNIESNGGVSVTLGPRILRTETASLVASSIVLYELSDLGGVE